MRIINEKQTFMKKIFVVFSLFVLINSESFCQFTIKQINKYGEMETLCNDSILTIEIPSFDSIVLDQLTVPKYDVVSETCYGCQGTIYVGFMVYENEILLTKTIRGFSKEFDLLFIEQHRIVLNNILKYAKFDNDCFYYIIVPIKFVLDDYNEIDHEQKFIQYDEDDSYFKQKYVLMQDKDIE